MIIITGSGRSGTSVLARIYKELGFDPGGNWIPKMRAGLEHGDFWRLNNRVARDLGITMLHPKPAQGGSKQDGSRQGGSKQGGSKQGGSKVAAAPRRSPRAAPAPASGTDRARRVAQRTGRAVQRRLPEQAQRVVRAATTRAEQLRPTSEVPSEPAMADWARFDRVVAKHGQQMRELAHETSVVKDPRFMFTLPVWAAAGAQIDHVIVTMRALSAVATSRRMANQSEFGQSELRNIMTYGVGLGVETLFEYELPHHFIRFPNFLENPEELYESLVFPEPVSKEKFLEVCEREIDLGQVHSWTDADSAGGKAAVGQ